MILKYLLAIFTLFLFLVFFPNYYLVHVNFSNTFFEHQFLIQSLVISFHIRTSAVISTFSSDILINCFDRGQSHNVGFYDDARLA